MLSQISWDFDAKIGILYVVIFILRVNFDACRSYACVKHLTNIMSGRMGL